MARTIEEIQESLQAEWMRSTALQRLYGFDPGQSFSAYYSKSSIESMLLYIVAYCAFAVEKVLDCLKTEIEEKIALQVPGRIDWYARLLKNYLYNFSLDDYGEFIIPEGATEADVNNARIVKHAVAIDDYTSGRIVLKVAGEDSSGKRSPLNHEQQTALEKYILRVKYAGVKTQLINTEGDVFDCEINLWYDPLRVRSEIEHACQNAVTSYVENLPFNGVFSVMALTDTLQAVQGVRLLQVLSCGSTGVDGTKTISDYTVPYAGYFTPGNIVFNMKEYTL